MNRWPLLSGSVLAAMAAACSAGPSANAPESAEPVRVFVEAMVFDVPAGGLPGVGVPAPSTASFGDLAERAGSRFVVSPHVLAANDEVARMSRPAPAAEATSGIDAAFASYRLDVKPHVIEPGRVRLDVDFDLAQKPMKTTVEVDDKQLVFLGTDVTVEGRRLVLVVRPNIVRNDGDLRMMFAERAARRPQTDSP